jgi:uncharacterized membrane protein YdcZ (DUF606 family)
MNEQLAWYIGGPVLGLCVVALRWLLNERLGATRAWADAIALPATGRELLTGTSVDGSVPLAAGWVAVVRTPRTNTSS